MKVNAAKGTQCPKEGKPREYITDGIAVDVPDTVYYRRLIADGSLIRDEETSTAAPAEAASSRSRTHVKKEGQDHVQ